MDWNQAIEEDRQTLKRIAATMLSLAVLAELLCHRSRPVRGFVLWILRYAEEVVSDFVLQTAEDLGMPISVPDYRDIPMQEGGDGIADALILAQIFRTLAMLLEWMADQNIVIRIPAILTALATIARILAEPAFSPRLLLATAQLSVERRDSS